MYDAGVVESIVTTTRLSVAGLGRAGSRDNALTIEDTSLPVVRSRLHLDIMALASSNIDPITAGGVTFTGGTEDVALGTGCASACTSTLLSATLPATDGVENTRDGGPELSAGVGGALLSLGGSGGGFFWTG